MKGKYWDKGWQLVAGCTPCSPGCDHCWSASMAHRFHGFKDTWHPERLTDDNARFTSKIILHPDRLNVPMKRKKPTVYAIWNDWAHESVPLDFVDNILEVIAVCPQHTFLACTKRAHLIDPKLYEATEDNPCRELGGGDYLPNLWLGLTVCNQQEADEKIPIFLQIPGKKFLSIEPMLGVINFRWMKWISREHSTGHLDILKDISCVILGSETGTGARPMHPDWARSVRDQCDMAGVPFFLKSMGSGKGRLLDGREHNDLPWRQL